MKKIGFLFGAGAEIDYGLPTGGKFALDIFREDITKSKDEFKEMRMNIDKTGKYTKWLPDDYLEKNISSFGKTILENIIKDTIEHKREDIIKKINDFDECVISALKEKEIEELKKIIYELIDKEVDDCRLSSVISFNSILSEGNKLFESNFFSALLLLYKEKDKLGYQYRKELGKILISIMQLQIGALGSKISKNLNDNMFSKKDDDIDLFDDIGDILHLNYRSTGVMGLEYLYENKEISLDSKECKIIFFIKSIMENIFSSVLDYKTLIDSNWHYLYHPKEEWAKFCKISIFLLTVKNYIERKANSQSAQKGYYDDLKEALDLKKLEISKVATTNYNEFIKEKINEQVIYLNGSINQWYDPYLNKIGQKNDLGKQHFLVPLLFTQSGTKPMTSIYKSIEYVELYESWKNSDMIIVVGFGFNSDDEHINGIIRTLILDYNKKFIVLSRHSTSKDIADKLKISSTNNIEIVNINNQRKSGEKLWLEAILDNLKD